MEELIIIGAGPMGLYGAFCAGMRDIKGVILESSYTYGGQVSALYAEKKIYDIPGFVNTEGQKFIDNLYNQYQRYEDVFPLELNTIVTEIIEHKDHFIINTNNRPYYTKKVLIANGGGVFTPRKMVADGFLQQSNVLYSVSKIEMFKDKKVAILGGGDSAADWALALADVASEVNLIHRRERFRAHKSTINQFLEKGNTITPYVPKRVIGEKNVQTLILEHRTTKEELELHVDYILVFYGVDNTKSEVHNWGIHTDKDGILVTQNMKTNIEGIYAAGNSVSYPGKLKMIVTGLGEIGTAIGEIANELYPDRRSNTIYSSILVKE